MAKDPRVFGDGIYFMTLTVVGWTDVFIRPIYRDIIVENLTYCVQNKGLEIHAFCLLTNHLHFIASAGDGLDLGKLIRSFKSFTGKLLLEAIEENPQESRKEWMRDRFEFLGRTRAKDTQRQFWERDNYPEEVRSLDFFAQKQKYIEMNPVKAGFVLRPEDWLHSSACPECPVPIVRF